MKDWIKNHVDLDNLVDAYYFLYKLGNNCTSCFREDDHKEEYVRDMAIKIFIDTNKAYEIFKNTKVKI